MGVLHSFEKNETATMFFLKKPSLVIECNLAVIVFQLYGHVVLYI